MTHAPTLLDRLYTWLPAVEPRQHKRTRLLEAEFPNDWREILRRRVPFWSRWPAHLQAEAEPLLHAFVEEHTWVGAKGFEITDDVRVVIGACAIRPILRLDLSLYDHLTEIIVYPFERLVVPGHGDRVLGVAHPHGVVVLSWPAVQKGLRRPNDGHDTALHEFAHILDLADGHMDGAPPMRARADIDPWGRTLGDRFEALQRGESSPLDPYAGTNMAEFFAVASEHFFERPRELQRRSPALFAQLERFYGWDPSDADAA
jgi:MtfA peptidase